MLSWGPDGHAIWYDGPIGLGQMMLFNTPQALNEKLPRYIANKPMVITAAARIDNRETLFSKLAIPHPQRAATPDSELISLAYEKWGDSCPQHILGDYAFAIWEPKKKSLFLARDHHGTTSLYYYDCAQFFAFASSIHALLTLHQIPKVLDELRLGQTMIYIRGEPQRTHHQGILHLLSAHTLRVSPTSLDIERYWYPENLPLLQLKNEEDYAAGLKEVLQRAVVSQTRSHREVGISLSGGLDSTAVAAFAAPALQERNQTLHAFSWIPAFDDVLTLGTKRVTEKPYVEKTAAYVGNIDLQFIDSKNIGLLESIQKSLDGYPGPLFTPLNMHWLHQMWDMAREQEIGTLLSGRLGNATISWGGLPSSVGLAHYLRQKRWIAALKYHLFFPLFPGFPQQRQIKRLQKTILQENSVNPEFATRIHLLEMFAQEKHNQYIIHWRAPLVIRTNILLPGCNILDAMSAEFCGAYGIERRDPTGHVDVIEYTLAVPDHIYSGKTGGERRLIRLAMQGLLPNEVIGNKRRGMQSSDIVARVRNESGIIENTLLRFQKDEQVQFYLDWPHIWSTWQKIKRQEFYINKMKNPRDVWTDLQTVFWGIKTGLFLQTYFP